MLPKEPAAAAAAVPVVALLHTPAALLLLLCGCCTVAGADGGAGIVHLDALHSLDQGSNIQNTHSRAMSDCV